MSHNMILFSFKLHLNLISIQCELLLLNIFVCIHRVLKYDTFGYKATNNFTLLAFILEAVLFMAVWDIEVKCTQVKGN